MKIQSVSIASAVQIAIEEGNAVKEISEGWTKVAQVVHMTGKMSSDTQRRIESEVPSLRYWESAATPQNPAAEGFISDQDKVGLSFPR
ncbi:hypothetical protein ACFFJT_09105 [Dyella flava]|uniref:ParD-like antitoxin of type II toxin-antitoxin system n=1 Tax=Dyella flava TaxID=1920170 RepID=A0ABS2KAE3_9GAMM|nr:hypothetical protein [Dyella flava]MBM7127750.1 hypothetical protein [Dyella flava]GLQ51350.1 hypothetical protein GCM10010872_27990 [Dyella flava]